MVEPKRKIEISINKSFFTQRLQRTFPCRVMSMCKARFNMGFFTFQSILETYSVLWGGVLIDIVITMEQNFDQSCCRLRWLWIRFWIKTGLK
jgi:hypothetical protein